jgi:hypothetical protein
MARATDPLGLLEPEDGEPTQQPEAKQDPLGLLEPETEQAPQAQQEPTKDPLGLLEPAEEKPSRLGAVGRAVAEEFVPATAAGLTVGALSRLPLPAVPKFLLGATGAVLAAGAAGRVQEQVARGVAGPEAVARFKEQRERDIAAYPASTFAASVLTPTAGALAGLGRAGISGIRGAISKAPQVAEEVAPKVEAKVGEAIPFQQELPLEGAGKTVSEIQAERAKLLPEAGPGQGRRRTAERMIVDPNTPEELAKKFADSRNRALYNKASPTSIAKDLRRLTPEARGAIAQNDDLVGNTAKTVILEDARLAGDIQTADSIFDTLYQKFTNAGQLLNVAKLIQTTPDGYAYILNKTLEKSARQFATKGEKELLEQGKKFTPEAQKEAMDLFKRNQIAQKEYADAKIAARTDLSKAAARNAIQKEDDALAASFDLATFEADLLARELGDQIPDYIKGNLLTTISQGANILGNTVNMPARAATRQVASLLDQIERNIARPIVERVPVVGKKLAERFLAKEKQFMSPLGKGSLERFIEVGKAGGRGIAEGVKGIRRGISPEGLLAGEDIRGFRPLRAAQRLFTGKGLAEPTAEGIGRIGAKTMDRIRLLSESTLGIPPEVMFRLLQLGDTPARRMAQSRLLTEARQLEGLKGEALRRAVRFPTQAEMDKVAGEVAEAVYQQDSALTRSIQYILRLVPEKLEQIPAIGKPLAGGARTAISGVFPFVKTPTNVIDELFEYSIPEYSLIRGLKNQATGNYRRAKLQFAKSVIGYSIRNVAEMISNAGLITEAPSKSEKVRDIQFQAEPPRMVNLTGMQRWIDSGFQKQSMEPGDYLVGLEKLGVVGGIMSTMNAAKKATQGGDGSAGEVWGATLPETLKFSFNQSFLKSMNSLLGAISRGEADDIDDWLTNYYGALTSAAIPNQLSAFSRYLNQSMPDKVRAKDIEGGEFGQKTLNTFKEIIKRKIPGDAAMLPARINVWGREIPNIPEGVDPFIYNFIDPTKGRKVTYDNITLAAYDLYRKTDKTEAIPPVPDRNMIVVNSRTGKKTKYRMEPYLYEKYAKMYGKANRKVAEELLSDKNFRKLEPEEQVKRLSRGYERAGKEARIEFISQNQRRIERGQEQ